MTGMTGPDCAVVVCHLLNTQTHAPTVCTRALYRGGNRIRGTGSSKQSRGRNQSRGPERRRLRGREGGRQRLGRGQSGNEDGKEGGIRQSGGEPKKRNIPHKSCRRDVENGVDLSGKLKNVDKRGLVQEARKQGGRHKIPRAQVKTVQAERVCPLCRV